MNFPRQFSPQGGGCDSVIAHTTAKKVASATYRGEILHRDIARRLPLSTFVEKISWSGGGWHIARCAYGCQVQQSLEAEANVSCITRYYAILSEM